MTLEELDLSIRPYKMLKRAGIHDVETLVTRTDDELMSIRGFGMKCLEEVRDKLGERGYVLGKCDVVFEISPGFEKAMELFWARRKEIGKVDGLYAAIVNHYSQCEVLEVGDLDDEESAIFEFLKPMIDEVREWRA